MVSEVSKVVDSVISQMENMPNVGFIEMWLQRLSLVSNHAKNYSDILCQKVDNASSNIWNSEWLKNNFPEDSIINREYIEQMPLTIPQHEIDLFNEYTG